MKIRLSSFFLVFTLICLIPIGKLQAATITVNGTGDTIAVDSTVTLREAIDSINNGSDDNADVTANRSGTYGTSDTINFNISGSVLHTIQPTSALPSLTKPMVIDGYTQPGTSQNTLANGDNAVLLIELDGTNAGVNADGLKLLSGAGGSTIRGLVINRFNGSGIELTGADNNVIEGNLVGTDHTGTVALRNFQTGLLMGGGSDNNLIGGTAPAARNLTAANGFGVQIGSGGGTGNLIQGNFIGTDMTGTAGLGNGVGVLIFDSSNTVGGLASGSSNLIAFNKATGVVIANSNPPGDAVLGNSIFSNGGLGIDLAAPPAEDTITPNDPGDTDTGSNNLQNFPDLTMVVSSSGTLTIQGTLNSIASSNYRIEFFANDACDPSGNGEGQTFLGAVDPVTTDGSGNANFNVNFQATGSLFITATATDATGDTSEFSKCLQATVENCTNGVDDDGDSLVDCNDPDCAADPACASKVEICNNNIDDDGDGLTDCSDPDCSTDPACQLVVSGSGCSLDNLHSASNASAQLLLLLAMAGMWLMRKRI